KYYGHKEMRLMNGGRVKWLNEGDKPMTTDKTSYPPTQYRITQTNAQLRALLPEVLQVSSARSASLVDVRSPDEFTGKVIAPPAMPEPAQRGAHIPGARSVPWATAVNTADGTFKSADELREIYFKQKEVDSGKPAIAYCRIGERSSHTWFVLKY